MCLLGKRPRLRGAASEQPVDRQQRHHIDPEAAPARGARLRVVDDVALRPALDPLQLALRRKKCEATPVTKLYNTGRKSARERAAEAWQSRHDEIAPEGFRNVRVHDLKHTFGRRLRVAGVSFEDRQDLVGHKSGRITTHYSQAELANLIAAAEKVCSTESRKTPATTWLRRKVS